MHTAAELARASAFPARRLDAEGVPVPSIARGKP